MHTVGQAWWEGEGNFQGSRRGHLKPNAIFLEPNKHSNRLAWCAIGRGVIGASFSFNHPYFIQVKIFFLGKCLFSKRSTLWKFWPCPFRHLPAPLVTLFKSKYILGESFFFLEWFGRGQTFYLPSIWMSHTFFRFHFKGSKFFFWFTLAHRVFVTDQEPDHTFCRIVIF